jgi:hypothetical protein
MPDFAFSSAIFFSGNINNTEIVFALEINHHSDELALLNRRDRV